MPVIQLPTDQRWGQVGQGLGGLLGSVLEGVNQRNVAAGVAQVWQDPNVKDDQKITESIRRWGPQGGQIAFEMLKAQQMAAQIQDVRSQQELRHDQSAFARARTEQIMAGLPFAAREALAKAMKEEAGVVTERAKPAEIQALAAEHRAKTGEVGSLIEEHQAQADRARREAELAGEKIPGEIAKSKLERFSAEAMQRAAQNANQAAAEGDPIGAQIAHMGLPPNEMQAAKDVYNGTFQTLLNNGVRPDKAATEAQKAMLGYAEKRQKPTGDIAPTGKEHLDHAIVSRQQAASADRFMDAFEKNPGTGFFARPEAFLATRGLPIDNPTYLEMREAVGFLQRDAARDTKQAFFSTAGYNIAHDLIPNMDKTPMTNIIAMKQTAEKQLVDLNTRLESLGTQRMNVDPLINARDHWQRVIARADAYKAWSTPDHENTVVTHNGSYLDRYNFKVLIPADKIYKFKDGTSVMGRNVVEAAREKVRADSENAGGVRDDVHSIDPMEFLKSNAAKHGGFARGSEPSGG